MSERVDMLTGVGRLVQGHPFESNDKNMEGQPLTDKAGNPRVEHFFAIAIPKTDPEFPKMWQKVQEVAQKGFPGGESQRPTFSWKYIDGDTKPDNEGFAGCHILKLKSSFAPQVFTKGAAGKMEQVVDATRLKRGDYIRAYVSVAANGSALQPGVYLNPNMVEIVGYGEAIASGPSGDDVFGTAPAALPAGASATPLAGAPIATGGPAMVTPGVVAPPVTPVVVAPPVAVQPAPDFLTPQAPAGVQLTAKAVAEGQTHAMLTAAGWTDELMRAHGYIV
jgi:hypothetical protein